VRKTDDLSMSLPVAGLTCLALRAPRASKTELLRIY
jgi:hypothetical protein